MRVQENAGDIWAPTLWKLMLSLNGITELIRRSFRSHVTVFLQTGRRIRAILSFKVSAAPLAVERQYPITSKADLCLYWTNFQANNPKQASSHSRTIHARRQYVLNKTSALDIGSCSSKYSLLWGLGVNDNCEIGDCTFVRLVLKRVSSWEIYKFLSI